MCLFLFPVYSFLPYLNTYIFVHFEILRLCATSRHPNKTNPVLLVRTCFHLFSYVVKPQLNLPMHRTSLAATFFSAAVPLCDLLPELSATVGSLYVVSIIRVAPTCR
ncbi:hypothetical protein BCR44DRAFT_1011596 [Catenaria anguillulae PL171]|uniref:Uncharacterized protein n=1 Tax=Catenaria anguillulae PL171 TaxID=765915 RepID=A0A1Y2I473_9FUNG|nr:hypothetical protein BCR44DRAFT_1011596 [Catenaria anguillulae PL171]